MTISHLRSTLGKNLRESTFFVVADLLFYALELSPRQRFLDVLQNTPDADVTLTEEEQLRMVDAVRQEVYEDQ